MTKNSKINLIKAREILDSRGNWTVEVDLVTDNGLFRDSAPSGSSKGKYEAPTVEPKIAIKNINKIIGPKLKGKDPTKQKEIDNFLNLLKFGANATTPVSMAVARAGAVAKNLPLWKYINQIYRERVFASLPRSCFNMINGGAHASNELDFQEFMIVCSVQKASNVYQNLRKKLGKNVGDEGGFAPPFKSPKEALELLSQYNVKIIIDVAASQFSERKKKIYNLDYFQNLVVKYPIIGLEDPFGEDDWQEWEEINSKSTLRGANSKIQKLSPAIAERGGRRERSSLRPSKFLIIGDDLLATNPKRIKIAREKNLCNGLLLKINQIGTVTKALEAAKLAKSYGWKIMVSHRSGETNDDFISDLAVGVGADYIKAGAPARGERVAKYNRLLKIEQEIYG